MCGELIMMLNNELESRRRFLCRTIALVLLSSCITSGALSQNKQHSLTGTDVMEKVAREYDGIRDFTVTMTTEVKMERLQIPKTSATMYFKKPDKIHFSSTNFFLVPKDGIALNPAVLAERYDASIEKRDTINGQWMYKLQLAAKEKKTRLRQLYAWIDPAHWTIAKVETIPYEGRTLAVDFVYELMQDKYWLPSKLTVAFGSNAPEGNSQTDSVAQPLEQLGHMQRGGPRNGSMTISYSDYLVNSGLPDEIFIEKEK